MRRTVLFLAVALLAPVCVVAAPITLTLESPATAIYQQTQNSPCVIGDPSCNNPAGFTYATIPANTDPYDVTSPDYTVAQIGDIVGGDSFMIGIDVNWTGKSQETLALFEMLVNDVVVASYSTTIPFVYANNGNGYSDALLKGFSLSGLQNGDIVNFRANVTLGGDGREEFFLVGNSTPVPEPATMLLLGTGLLGLGVASRRRRR